MCRRIYFCISRYNYLGYLLRGSGRLVTRFYDFLLILVTLLNRLPREYLNSKVRPKYPSSYNLFWRNTLNVINKIQFRNSHRYGQQALIAANPHFHYLCYMPRSFNFLKHKYQISAFLYTLSKNFKPHQFPSKKVLKYSTCAKKKLISYWLSALQHCRYYNKKNDNVHYLYFDSFDQKRFVLCCQFWKLYGR